MTYKVKPGGAELRCASCGSRNLEPVEHRCSKPKVVASGGTMCETGEPGPKVWFSDCNGCGWAFRDTAQVAVVIAATEHEAKHARSLFSEAS